MTQDEIMRGISDCYQTYNNKTAEDVRALYEQIEDPNVEHYGKPLLHYPAARADAIGVEILLAKGADATFLTEYNYSPLHALAYGDRRDYPAWADAKRTTELLLEAGTSPIRKDIDNVTCTFIGARNGHYEMLEAIAEAGKKMDLTNNNGELPLHEACDRAVRAAESFYKYTKPKYDEVMAQTTDGSEYQERELARKREHHQEQYDKDTAVMDRYFKTVKCLVDAGMDSDQKDNYGKTSKEVAFACQDIRISALLNGTYVEGAENDETAKLEMLTKGMNLMQAVDKQDYDAVEALLKMGADPNEFYGEEFYNNSFNLQGKAPLALACAMLDGKMTDLLIANGANPNLKDAEGKMPIAYLFGANVFVHVNHSTFENKIIENLLKAMVENEFDVNEEIDEEGNTLLNLACRNYGTGGRYNGKSLAKVLVNQLLRYKANPNIASNKGLTPLMFICQRDDSEMEDVQISLLEANADVGAQDKEGNTPLIYAVQNRNKSLAKNLADMLFEFGDPKLEAVNNAGMSALAFATEENNENLVNYLLMKM